MFGHSPSTHDPEAHPRSVRHLILGTAGHIDHGKTSLVRALTGVDTDRLPEEKRRGMTIELGFAELALDGVTFGVVDVPGHEKFVRTMVAGATAIDVALLVVAADDSVMPQTVEHVEILNLLGVRAGVVAVTKCDIVDDDLAELVAVEVAELLAGTRFAAAPIVRVSSTTGAGLDRLRGELLAAACTLHRPRLDQPFRLCIDRVFSVPGRGTVVTGSVLSGRLAAGDAVEVWPGPHPARAREVQSHNRGADGVEAGQRAAVNLQGVDLSAVDRGSELAAPGTFVPTHWLDVQLDCLASHTQPIRNHARLRLCLGTRELLVRCVLLDQPQLLPGASGLAQLRCRDSLVAAHGQRFIVRDENAARTAGGGVVLRTARRRASPRMLDDIEGLRMLRAGSPADRLEETIRYRGFAADDASALALAAHLNPSEIPEMIAQLIQSQRLVMLPGIVQPISTRWLAQIEQRATAWLAARHHQHPDEPGTLLETFTGYLERRSHRAAARPILERMRSAGTIRCVGRFVCLAQFAPALSQEDERVLAALLATYAAAAFQPPSLDELATKTGAKRPRVEKLVKIAASHGQLVRVDASTLLHSDCEAEMRTRIRSLFDAEGPFTMSRMREALDTSRKYAVPLAEYLDRIGFTRREGDQRVVVDKENA